LTVDRQKIGIASCRFNVTWTPKTPKRQNAIEVASATSLRPRPSRAHCTYVFDDCRCRARVVACAMGATRPSQIGCDLQLSPLFRLPVATHVEKRQAYVFVTRTRAVGAPERACMGLHGEGGRLPACLRHHSTPLGASPLLSTQVRPNPRVWADKREQGAPCEGLGAARAISRFRVFVFFPK
jgi:hypothetical protein